MKKIIVGLTGASGSILAYRLMEALLSLGHEVHFVSTEMGKQVMAFELERPFEDCMDSLGAVGSLIRYESGDLFAAIASGSFSVDGMVVLPCSMGTLAKISTGISDSLLCRAADVALKERRPLVLVARETPLSSIHLENMLKLSRMGAFIMPPVPAFYNKPKSLDQVIDQLVGRVLNTLGIHSELHQIWREGDFSE